MAQALLTVDTFLRVGDGLNPGDQKMTKALIAAAIIALSLTACSKPSDGGAAPPAGLSQLGGHSK
jgi:hypothetical protein